MKENICLFFSHINPLLFLIILKPFQKQLRNTANLALRSHESGFGLARETDKKTQGTFRLTKTYKKQERKQQMRKFLVCSVFPVLLLLLLIVISASSKQQMNGNEIAQKLSGIGNVWRSAFFSEE